MRTYSGPINQIFLIVFYFFFILFSSGKHNL